MNLLDVQELLERGWRKWTDKVDKDGRVLMLCPIVDYINVPDGTVMESLSGIKSIKGKDYIDLESRVGLIGYGVRA